MCPHFYLIEELIAVIKELIGANYEARGFFWLTIWRDAVHWGREGMVEGSSTAEGACSSYLFHGANKESGRRVRARATYNPTALPL